MITIRMATCRVCVKQDGLMINIFEGIRPSATETPVSEMVSQCTGYPVVRGDVYPDTICPTCLISVQNAFELKQTYAKSQQIFDQLNQFDPNPVVQVEGKTIQETHLEVTEATEFEIVNETIVHDASGDPLMQTVEIPRRKCCMQVQEKLDEILRQMGDMQVIFGKKLDTIEKNSGSTKTTISRYVEKEEKCANKLEFPITEKDEMTLIDDKIRLGPEPYIRLFRNLILPEGWVKNIERIFARSLLMRINYSGETNKIALVQFVYLNKALFEATKEDGRTMEDHKKDLREAIQKAKNRHYKNQSRTRTKAAYYA
ncbi:hypothetical protein KR018_007997 [Drosophila ironensis]|nr:hypothetical protein KR018_007997 [Drosophila ironensis]